MKRTPQRNAELARRRAEKKLYAQRRAKGQCTNCGRSDWVDCVDNDGRSYKGCKHCVIVLPPELGTVALPSKVAAAPRGRP